MNVGLIDTGLKRVHRRVLNDGIFFISSKTTSKNVLGVIEQSFNDHASLINESLTKNANQCFFIKYNDDEDYHTIMALHSHQFIGVEPKEDGNYDFSLICQTVKNDNYLIQWRINLCDDSYFIIQLKDTDFVFEFQKDLNIPVLKEKSDTDIQKFSIKTIRTVNPGIYKINLQFEPKLFLSLSGGTIHAYIFVKIFVRITFLSELPFYKFLT